MNEWVPHLLGKCKCEKSWQVVMRISVVSETSIGISIFYPALTLRYLTEPSRFLFIRFFHQKNMNVSRWSSQAYVYFITH